MAGARDELVMAGAGKVLITAETGEGLVTAAAGDELTSGISAEEVLALLSGADEDDAASTYVDEPLKKLDHQLAPLAAEETAAGVAVFSKPDDHWDSTDAGV
ncbi:hypothetical protein GGI08_004358 [Coemansia sp. S2]|nr:hypothetical protein GGI08_004358 [Coemansia sp. S2]